MNIILKTIFEGVYGEESTFNCLQGTPHIVKEIWFLIKHAYRIHIKVSELSNVFMDNGTIAEAQFLFQFQDCEVDVMYHESGTIFPEPKNININMMHYIYGGYNFEDYKLSDILEPYFPLIRFCKTGEHLSSDKGKIFYLTIQEG